MTEDRLTVLLVDDHELIRQGLARAFERSPDFTVAGEAGTVAEGLRLARTLSAPCGAPLSFT